MKMFKQNKSVAALLLSVLMLFSVVQQIRPAYAMEDGDVSEIWTVTFIAVGAADYPKEVKVVDGTPAPAQPIPVLEGKVFTGWYYIEDHDTPDDTADDEILPFDFNNTLITKNMTVTAYFANAAYQMIFYLGNGTDNSDQYTTVIQTLSVAEGGIAVPAVFPDGQEPNGLLFTGNWLVRSTSDETIAVGDVLDFNLPINGNFELEPEFKPGYVVSFESGGSPVDPQNAYEGYPLTPPPTPTRAGYSFDGWYMTPDFSGVPYAFDEEITDDAELINSAGESGPTLYGKWTSEKVNFTIEYWVEKANLIDSNQVPIDPGDPTSNPDNYEYVMSHASSLAEQQYTGTLLTFDEVKAIANNSATLALANGVNSAMEYSRLTYVQSEVIEGSGNTVIKVYYTRKIFQITINVENSNHGANNLGSGATNAYLLHDGVEYQTSAQQTPYTFQVKYEQDISKVWPRLAEVLSASKTPYGWWVSSAMEPHEDFSTLAGNAAFMIKPVMDAAGDTADPIPVTVWVTYSSKLFLTYMLTYIEATDEQRAAIPDDTVNPEWKWVNGQGPVYMPTNTRYIDGETFAPYFYESVTGKFFVLDESATYTRMYANSVGGGNPQTYSPHDPLFFSVPPMLIGTTNGNNSPDDISKSLNNKNIWNPDFFNSENNMQYQYTVQQRNSFNVTAMSFDPEMIFKEIKNHIPNFKIEYHVDPLKKSIAESWPNSMDDHCAREEWGWEPKYNLKTMTTDMLTVLKKKLVK